MTVNKEISYTQAISTVSACNSPLLFNIYNSLLVFIDVSVFLKHNFKNLLKTFIPKATYL
jgi:hypothetical protein